MALNGHSGDEQVISQSKLLIGIDKFKVVAINPNMEQLRSIDINAQKESEYLGIDKNGNAFTKIDIWLKGDVQERPIKFTSFVRNETVLYKEKNKEQWINNFGVTATIPAGTIPEYDWFKNTGQRKAFVGEDKLIKFLRAWVNAASTDEVFIETWDDIFRGNMKELKEVLSNPKFKDNKVRAMMWVRESNDNKFFQEICPEFFTPAYVSSVTGWVRAFKSYIPKGITYSYDIKEFKPNIPTPDVDAPAENTATNNDWV